MTCVCGELDGISLTASNFFVPAAEALRFSHTTYVTADFVAAHGAPCQQDKAAKPFESTGTHPISTNVKSTAHALAKHPRSSSTHPRNHLPPYIPTCLRGVPRKQNDTKYHSPRGFLLVSLCNSAAYHIKKGCRFDLLCSSGG